MESKEYRLEEYSGELYTEEEFMARYLPEISDPGLVKYEWNLMLVVPTDKLPMDELRKKMRFLYSRGIPLHKGDIIKEDISHVKFGHVTRACGRLFVEEHMPGVWSFAPTEWKGKYIKIANVSGSVR